MKGRRWARWLPLLPFALLVGVVLTPPPDDYAFLGEGATPVPLASVEEHVAEWRQEYRMRDERDRAWRVAPTGPEMKRRIRARLPACKETGWASSKSSFPGKPTRILDRATVYQNPDTGAIVILAEDLRRGTRTVVVREPRGAAALPGRFRSLVRRTFGR